MMVDGPKEKGGSEVNDNQACKQSSQMMGREDRGGHTFHTFFICSSLCKVPTAQVSSYDKGLHRELVDRTVTRTCRSFPVEALFQTTSASLDSLPNIHLASSAIQPIDELSSPAISP